MRESLTAILLIMVVLLTPVACFAHPCTDFHAATDSEVQLQLFSPEQGPPQLEADCCETSCCCADYLQLAPLSTVAYSPAISRNRIPALIAVLPQVSSEIYVPPKNRNPSA
ncbi:hypothetical protein GMSM_39640 [Geomonas sp. Red276]